jgi:phage-related protein
MITIGDYTFPEESTFFSCQQVEAKSKVRKSIRMQSMIRETNLDQLDETINLLRREVERFDRQETTVSVEAGRYYYGRRRECTIVPMEFSCMIWFECELFTLDRYERSIALYEFIQDTVNGICIFTCQNSGNWESPTLCTITNHDPIEQIAITIGDHVFSVNQSIEAEKTIVIDAEHRTVTVDGVNIFFAADEPFVFLQPGENEVQCQITPQTASSQVCLEYRDFWI